MEILLIIDTYLSSVSLGGSVIKSNNDNGSEWNSRRDQRRAQAVRREWASELNRGWLWAAGLITVTLCWSPINLPCFPSDSGLHNIHDPRLLGPCTRLPGVHQWHVAVSVLARTCCTTLFVYRCLIWLIWNQRIQALKPKLVKRERSSLN